MDAASIDATMKASGRTRQEVIDAARNNGFVIEE